LIENHSLRRDNVGYIGAIDMKGDVENKVLHVNGIGMTYKTTVTKLMAHLSLAHHPTAQSAMVICFGQGTTVRSLLSWPVKNVTAVELSKGVVESFGQFHKDAEQILADARLKVVIDDGRRYLNRTSHKYDIITIDPPPPVSASGSGLLYTKEFLALIKEHMSAGAILQHWIFTPTNEQVYVSASLNAIGQSFRYVKSYKSIEKGMGIHVLASDAPLPDITPEDFRKILPDNAKHDLMEWEHELPIEEVVEKSLQPIGTEGVIPPSLRDIFMSDDRLYNEFYAVRVVMGPGIAGD
jgi:spermidine synthase